MAHFEMVNSFDHQHIKINTRRSAQLGDNLWFCITFPDEFRAVQAHYPIFFQKDAQTGQFAPVALFGFENNDNLFLDDTGWDAGYIPVAIARQPFTIGHQEQQGQTKRVLTLDMEHPRVNESEGQALFLEFGGNSDYLEQIAAMMEALHLGLEENKVFADTLTKLQLLEPFTLDVQLNDSSKHQMVGFYTINEQRLAELSKEEIHALLDAGYLQAIYFILASQGNVSHLLKRKNQRLGL